MIGIILVTHGDLGKEMINSAHLIVGDIPFINHCSLQKEDKTDRLKERLEKTIYEMRGLDGIIILSDLFGGTPSNLSMLESRRENVRTISGVNLTMLLTCILEREQSDLDELAEQIVLEGREGIKFTSRLLKEGTGHE